MHACSHGHGPSEEAVSGRLRCFRALDRWEAIFSELEPQLARGTLHHVHQVHQHEALEAFCAAAVGVGDWQRLLKVKPMLEQLKQQDGHVLFHRALIAVYEYADADMLPLTC